MRALVKWRWIIYLIEQMEVDFYLIEQMGPSIKLEEFEQKDVLMGR